VCSNQAKKKAFFPLQKRRTRKIYPRTKEKKGNDRSVKATFEGKTAKRCILKGRSQGEKLSREASATKHHGERTFSPKAGGELEKKNVYETKLGGENLETNNSKEKVDW